MRDQLISFETAKLAKDKKLNVKCKLFYKENGDISESTILSTNNFFKNVAVNYYSAPTQSLLQKWLREVHNIIVVLDYEGCLTKTRPYIYKFTHYSFYIHKFNDEFETADESNTKNYDVYEDALEEALQIGLNLIK